MSVKCCFTRTVRVISEFFSLFFKISSLLWKIFQFILENFQFILESYIFRAIKKTDIVFTRTGNPKGIEGPLKQLSGFSWKFVQKNKEILFGNHENQPQKSICEAV